MKIKTVYYALLTPGQLFNLSEGTLSLAHSAQLPEGPLVSFLSTVDRCHQDFSKGFQRDDKNPYTEEKAQRDSERDEAFLAFRGYVEACTHRPDASVTEPAEEILEVIRKYGWSSWSEGYQKQSALHTNMIEELKQEHAEQMNAIGAASPWFEELEQAQAAFSAVKISSVSNTPDCVTLSETRKPLEQSLRNFYAIVDLLAQSEENETLNQLIRDLNQLITETMAIARAAQTRRDKEQEEVEPGQN
ncbi:DUF6261 family protein [Thermophagus sp. OGC60D27]|uniref:DUF6261 family protein n=1 Tax=Thermophagus sp. OGC60D27 TaxID=3458415 RepID=UPI004037D5C8